jgi:hypothetical protein
MITLLRESGQRFAHRDLYLGIESWRQFYVDRLEAQQVERLLKSADASLRNPSLVAMYNFWEQETRLAKMEKRFGQGGALCSAFMKAWRVCTQGRRRR